MIKRIALVLVLLASPALAQEYPDHLGKIGVTSQLHTQYTGDGVRVANMDGYPDLSHRDLSGSVAVYSLFAAPRFPNRWTTDHATHAIGGINGRLNGTGIVGVAPGAYVFGYPIWTSADTLAYGAPPNLGRVYADARNRGVKVINRELTAVRLSAGVYRWEAVFAAGALEALAPYRDAFVVVQPAGNNGLTILNQPYANGGEVFANLLLVGGSDYAASNRPGERCFYAAGATVCREQDKLKHMYVVASASNIRSSTTGGGTRSWSGTSFASPQVAGLVALLFEKARRTGVPLTTVQTARIVCDTATDMGAPGHDGVFGCGLVNAERALEAIKP